MHRGELRAERPDLLHEEPLLLAVRLVAAVALVEVRVAARDDVGELLHGRVAVPGEVRHFQLADKRVVAVQIPAGVAPGEGFRADV